MIGAGMSPRSVASMLSPSAKAPVGSDSAPSPPADGTVAGAAAFLALANALSPRQARRHSRAARRNELRRDEAHPAAAVMPVRIREGLGLPVEVAVGISSLLEVIIEKAASSKGS